MRIFVDFPPLLRYNVGDLDHLRQAGILRKLATEKMNDYTLEIEIKEAKKGNEAALAAIIMRQMPLIRRIAWRAVRPGLDFDDAVQEGLIGLLRAVMRYDTSNAASFKTYSAVCIRNAIASAARAADRKKHAPLNMSVPLTERHTAPGPEEQAIVNEEILHILRKVDKCLSAYEKSIFRLMLQGFGAEEISAKLGRPLKSVENALSRARQKLR